jgi:hypothetical protein
VDTSARADVANTRYVGVWAKRTTDATPFKWSANASLT